MNQKLAVLLPCYNEELTIGKVVRDFRKNLPDAEIYVYDNNSSDRSVEEAMAAGAHIRKVPMKGKGHVIRRMFQEIEADCYIMADSDDTYPADEVMKLVEPILSGYVDMVTGDRISSTYVQENKRPFHNFGNALVCKMIGLLFHKQVSDVMTGYRAFNRSFVKNCPILSSGFELETEMTLHALDKRMAFLEIPIRYQDRPAGSYSKLNTYSDGFRVLKTIFLLFKDYRPLLFFGILGLFCILGSIIVFIPIFIEYLNTGLVPRFPTLFCGICLAVIGTILLNCGVILDSVKRYFDQLFELNLTHSPSSK